MTVEQGRRGGRTARRKLRTATPIVSMPTLVRDIPVYEILDEEGVELIHDASMKILEEVGIDFRDEEALAIWKQAGADVEDQRVHIARELLMSLVAKTPDTYTMYARNPEHSIKVGGRNTIFCPTYGSPYVIDLKDERRYSTLEDLTEFSQTRIHGAEPTYDGRYYLRAHRYPGAEAPPPHRL